MPQVASCMFMYLPALSCTVVHREREKERKREERGRGEKDSRNRSAALPAQGPRGDGPTE